MTMTMRKKLNLYKQTFIVQKSYIYIYIYSHCMSIWLYKRKEEETMVCRTDSTLS
jgi:hypothetical protein